MLARLIHLFLLLSVASCRIIDIHIETAEDSSVNGINSTASCYWDGTSPFCAGGCPSGYSDCATSSCGDGACCVTGYKKYCCRGGCDKSTAEHHKLEVHPGKMIHSSDGDNDDLCNEDEFVCCPPAASRNKECKCIKKKKAPSFMFSGLAQKTLDDNNPGGQLCKDKQTLCCNPGAENNEECACIDE